MTEAKRFPRACVASPHYLASSAGLQILARGGNALDAAISTNLALGVVAPYMCGYGGDLFAIVYDGELHGYNGSGRAPAAATPDATIEAARQDAMPGRGPLSVTVPGAVEAWFTLLDRFGTKPFAELAAPALALARDGFPLTSTAAGYIRASAQIYTAQWSAAWRDVYAAVEDRGKLVQPDLARTIATLVERGPQAFYSGEIAEAIAGAVKQHGGLLEPSDLASHRGDWVTPLAARYRDVDVYEMPPNSQGVAALEALRILDTFGADATGSAREHLLIEATKLALADRDRYVTDPDHMAIDVTDLFSDRWVDERRAHVDADRASAPASGRAAVGGTIYLCAADSEGMLVSLIESNYVGFGSGVTVPGWGINLQNRGAYFSLDSDHPNVIAPGKRTVHTLMPGMAFREGRPWLVFGTMGGDGQAQTHVQLLAHMIDGGLDPQEAIHAPRWVVSPDDWSVELESRFSDEVVSGLQTRGHAVTEIGPYETRMGHAHAIEVTDNGYAAGTDPRAEGAALGF